MKGLTKRRLIVALQIGLLIVLTSCKKDEEEKPTYHFSVGESSAYLTDAILLYDINPSGSYNNDLVLSHGFTFNDGFLVGTGSGLTLKLHSESDEIVPGTYTIVEDESNTNLFVVWLGMAYTNITVSVDGNSTQATGGKTYTFTSGELIISEIEGQYKFEVEGEIVEDGTSNFFELSGELISNVQRHPQY